ncbi:GNAT family N-acetyltransferase [Halobaculum sp. MBLA0147]|uniref:GNAT family N-acetyltransferase n=1 Tax=Halobaculum sp. MBLA0147 TaxID=3079934 RepID=UPI0035263887
MPGHVFRRGDRVALRTVEPEDDEFLARHRNDPAIRYPNGEYEPLSSAGVERYRREAVEGDDGVTLLACVDGEPVGLVFLFDESVRRGVAEVGYWIAPDERGQGYATAAAGLLVDHAFRERGLRKVVAELIAENDASAAVVEKLGFQREGRHRRELLVDGSYRDLLRFGLFADEFDGRPTADVDGL